MKYLEEEKGLGKPNKKDKPWIIEWKWKSEKDYHTYPDITFFNKKPYTDKWQKRWFQNKFSTAKAALESLKSDLKYLDQPKDSFWEKWHNHLRGKEFRIRNTKTGEIINYE